MDFRNENVLRHVKCLTLCFHSTVLKQSNLFLGSGLEKLLTHSFVLRGDKDVAPEEATGRIRGKNVHEENGFHSHILNRQL